MNSKSDAENTHSGDENDPPRDPRAAYALTIQRVCKAAVREIQDKVNANGDWKGPVMAAPWAIGTMAILLKTAGLDAAAGLEIESQEVRDERGEKVLGKLPSRYFHTNLQHCSDLGRLAFLEAQNGMNQIRATARSMIVEEGTISYIIELLEDPEEAKENLLPEIDNIKRMAQKCLQNAQNIQAKFDYWHHVIMHLKQTSLSRRGQVFDDLRHTEAQKWETAANELKYQEKAKASEDKTKILEEALKEARREVSRAEREVDRLKTIPITPEPRYLEELARVRSMIPDTPPPVKDRGLVTMVRDTFLGQSEKDWAEDGNLHKSHAERLLKLEAEAMTKAQAQRERERKAAADRLSNAQAMEDKWIAELKETRNELSAERDRLAETRADLARTQGELKKLVSKERTLGDIMEVLQSSAEMLGKLKGYVEQLVAFFQANVAGIDSSIDESVKMFVKQVERGVKKGANEEVEAIRLTSLTKKRVLSLALQMQGRFAAISRIASGYVAISGEYIRPTINEMEILALSTDAEWERQQALFDARCARVADDIARVAGETDLQVQGDIRRHINLLQQRAIEAADLG
ncbi:hypothetical protein TWF696_001583 [Orbilia brochopaga]|uniref:Uncharacterized protein n=1 Tax=Orbilia brochopaga TaxID=3140254 RepID=A0AAV9U938_9PEZI